jgi:hypothetical protein
MKGNREGVILFLFPHCNGNMTLTKLSSMILWWLDRLRNLLKNRRMFSGVISLALGIFSFILGFLAFVNYSETCSVTPGLSACTIRYQVALLAPLYPMSVYVMAIGALFAVTGYSLAVLGSKADGVRPGISKST